jgi:hypothetical protein
VVLVQELSVEVLVFVLNVLQRRSSHGRLELEASTAAVAGTGSLQHMTSTIRSQRERRDREAVVSRYRLGCTGRG